MLYIDLANFTRVEMINGREFCNLVLVNTGLALKNLDPVRLGGKRILGV
jgi:hypothetical protein